MLPPGAVSGCPERLRSLPPAQLRSLGALQREVPLVQSPPCSLPAMQEMLGLFGQGMAAAAASRRGWGRGARGRVRAPRRGDCEQGCVGASTSPAELEETLLSPCCLLLIACIFF